MTWIVEGHQQEGARMLSVVGLALDDGVSSESSRSDLLEHAACGVHDEHQCRGLLHPEEPFKQHVLKHKHQHSSQNRVL